MFVQSSKSIACMPILFFREGQTYMYPNLVVLSQVTDDLSKSSVYYWFLELFIPPAFMPMGI